MDVGGTLAKIVYFQPVKNSGIGTPSIPANMDGAHISSNAVTNIPMASMMGLNSTNLVRRQSSDSLAQLEDPDHQAALTELYSYMDSRDALRTQNGVVRDESLSCYSDFLEGSPPIQCLSY